MTLFGKKKEKQKNPVCCCGSGAEESNCCTGAQTESPACTCGSRKEESSCCTDAGGIRSVKVLGAGCKSCHELYENTKAAAKAMGLSLEVEYITDMKVVMTYGVMKMPAIVVNEQVVSMGRVLKTADVEKLLHQLEH